MKTFLDIGTDFLCTLFMAALGCKYLGVDGILNGDMFYALLGLVWLAAAVIWLRRGLRKIKRNREEKK